MITLNLDKKGEDLLIIREGPMVAISAIDGAFLEARKFAV
jgi:hypothetical protein